MIRLDKYLADAGAGTRSEVKLLIRKGRITVNSMIEKSPDRKIEPGKDEVCLDQTPVEQQEKICLLPSSQACRIHLRY